MLRNSSSAVFCQQIPFPVDQCCITTPKSQRKSILSMPTSINFRGLQIVPFLWRSTLEGLLYRNDYLCVKDCFIIIHEMRLDGFFYLGGLITFFTTGEHLLAQPFLIGTLTWRDVVFVGAGGAEALPWSVTNAWSLTLSHSCQSIETNLEWFFFFLLYEKQCKFQSLFV